VGRRVHGYYVDRGRDLLPQPGPRLRARRRAHRRRSRAGLRAGLRQLGGDRFVVLDHHAITDLDLRQIAHLLARLDREQVAFRAFERDQPRWHIDRGDRRGHLARPLDRGRLSLTSGDDTDRHCHHACLCDAHHFFPPC
jgi:hypothetical protein